MIAELRDALEARSRGRCERCGDSLHGSWGWSLHHRKPRGMGGSKKAVTSLNVLSNVLALCGSGTTGCHGWVESNRSAAYADGWLVHRWDDPQQKPVRGYGGQDVTLYLWDDGSLETGDEHVARIRDLYRDLYKEDPSEPYRQGEASTGLAASGEADGPLGPSRPGPGARGGGAP